MRLVSVLLLTFISAAQAQPVTPPSPPTPLPPPAAVAPIVVMPLPLPPQGCIWASRAFSDGAAFCVAASTQIVCKAGKWDASSTEACRAAAPIDAS
jgi:hypothetical protein